MNWFVAAGLSALALSGQALFFQRLQRLYPITTFVTYIWLGTAFVLGLIFLRPADYQSIADNIIPLVGAGLSSWGGIYAYNRAFRTQNNAGYIEAIIAIRTAIVYIFSLFAFSAIFDLVKLAGVIAISIGVLIVSEAFPFLQDKEKVKPTNPTPEATTYDGQMGWLGWSFVAALMFTILTIFVRYATDGGARAEVAIVVVLIVAGLVFLLQNRAQGDTLRIARPHIVLIILTIAVSSVGNVTDFISFQNAPNLAYSIAISNTRIIILYILGMLLFSEKLQRSKAFAIILTFIGVILLA